MELVVDNLNCGYDRHNPILSYVSFMLHDGDICCLLGPNGCGKTTLFKTILGLEPALSGRVLLDGENILVEFVDAHQEIMRMCSPEF